MSQSCSLPLVMVMSNRYICLRRFLTSKYCNQSWLGFLRITDIRASAPAAAAPMAIAARVLLPWLLLLLQRLLWVMLPWGCSHDCYYCGGCFCGCYTLRSCSVTAAPEAASTAATPVAAAPADDNKASAAVASPPVAAVPCLLLLPCLLLP
jgi:hypothetical protein